MNEQLLLSKAFWRKDEFDDAIQSIVKMSNSIRDKKWDEITKEDCLKYLDSIEIAIESMPKYVGVFNYSSGINYRGFTYSNLRDAFTLYVFMKCSIYRKRTGKESVLKPIFDTTEFLFLDSYACEYASAYEISAFTRYKLVWYYVGMDLSSSSIFKYYRYDERWVFHEEDAFHGHGIFIPVVMIKDGKLGSIKDNSFWAERRDQNCEAYEEYFKSHPGCRDTYNAFYNKLDIIQKKKDEIEKEKDELDEKEESCKNKIEELNEKIKYNNEEIIGLNKKLIKGKATKQRIEELNSEIESLKKEVDNTTEAKNNALDQYFKTFDKKDELNEEVGLLIHKYQDFLEKNDGLVEYEWRD